MFNSDKQQLIEIIRHITNGFDGVRRDLHGLGTNPIELEEASKALRELEYKLMAEIAPAEPEARRLAL